MRDIVLDGLGFSLGLKSLLLQLVDLRSQRPNTVEEFAEFRERQIEFFAGMVQTANIRID